MVLAKSKNAVGLGNRYRVPYSILSWWGLKSSSLMNDRFGKGKGSDRKKVTSAGIHRINHATGETVGGLGSTVAILAVLTKYYSMLRMIEKKPAG